jgi:hypothetical protein
LHFLILCSSRLSLLWCLRLLHRLCGREFTLAFQHLYSEALSALRMNVDLPGSVAVVGFILIFASAYQHY